VRAATLVAVAMIFGACQAGPPTTPGATPTATAATGASATPSPTPHVIPSIGPDRTLPAVSPDPQLDHIAVALEPFATVPDSPLAMTAPDDGTGRLFVAAQEGRIWVVERDGNVLAEPMLDISAIISSGGERGLLGVATHPAFPTDPRVFVNYTNPNGNSIVASVTVDPADPDRLDPDSLTTLLRVDQPYANHNGGGVLFGSDGKLYLSFGDGGSGGDPLGKGQDRNSLLGKILRIDVDGDPAVGPYIVPPDNPFAGGGGLPEIWHWGLRNPWRLSFDRANGDLWIGDVGQGAWEEIDVARVGVGGLNFGWNVMEGSHCYNKRTCKTEGLTFPVSDYSHDLGCTVIGGYVYRGSRFDFLTGAYLFADYCSGTVFAIDSATTGLVPPVAVGDAGGTGTSAFGEDANGELYLTKLNGSISRVVATER
jgi:glucose/arabinose dehydrogenase